MKRLIILLIVLIPLVAQINPDQYIEKLPGTEGKSRVVLLNKIASVYRDLSNFSEAENYAEDALQLATELNYKEEIIDAQNNLAAINLLSNRLEEGIKLTRISLSESESEEYKYGIATALRNIGIYYINKTEFEKSIDTLELAFDYFEEIEDTLGIAASLTSLGVAYSRTNEIEKSVVLYERAAELYLSQGSKYQAAHAYLNLGSIHSTILGNYEKGVSYTTNALENFEKVGDEFKAAYARLILGITYEELGNLEKPIELYNKAKIVFEEAGNSYLVANAINNLGEVYKKRKEFEKAIEYYNETLQLSRELNNEEGIAVALNNLGECNFELGDFNEAKTYYDKSFEILSELDDKFKMSISLNNQAEVLLALNQPVQAIDKAEAALELAKNVKNRNEQFKSYRILYQVYEQTGNFRQSLFYFKQYHDINDSLNAIRSSEQTKKILAEYESVQKESEIELLRATNEVKEAQIDRQQTITFFLIAISFLLLLFAGIYYKRYMAHKETNKQLAESEKELKELNKTKDLFFSIIAHDLKGPFNSLLGITEMLAEDIDELSNEEIHNLSREVNQNARNVYKLLENLLEWSSTQLGKYNFNPESFDLNEIVTQNVNLYRKMAKDKNISLNVDLKNDVSVCADKNMIDSALRNLINNSIKFTERGGNINVITENLNGNVLLRVRDNGIGMSQNEIDKVFKLESDIKKLGTEKEKGTGLGLVLARDFVYKNNGTIDVESEEGEGTTFTITLPAEK